MTDHEKPKIAFIGAGSPIWTGRICADLVETSELGRAELCLHDIDEEGLSRGRTLCEMIAHQAGSGLTVSATPDLNHALADASYVVVCIAVGGRAADAIDREVPQKYGIYAPVGDTCGPGGLNRALRNIPVFLDIARAMERYSRPGAWMLNASNPLAQICRAVTRETSVRAVGICHGVKNTLALYLKLLDADPATDTVAYRVGGIDHFNWFHELSADGRDGLEMLKERGYWGGKAGLTPEVCDVFAGHQGLRIVFQMWEVLGALPAIPDRHFVEFMPGFCTAAGIEKHGLRVDTNAEWDARRHDRETLRDDQIADREPLPQLSLHDNVVPIIAALEGHGEYTGVMNMPNVGQMPDLPSGAVVETQCHVDSGGIHPLAGGPLPSPVHTLVAGHVERYEMSVEAAVTGDAALAIAALASDPQLTDPLSAKPMVHEMLKEGRQWLPQC